MPKPAANAHSRSRFHDVNQRSSVSSGGSAAPVRISAGVRTAGRLAVVGGAVRARAAAAPLARPMNAELRERRVPRIDGMPHPPAVRPIRRLRYQAPSTPSASSAPTFTSRIAPYGEARFSHAPTAIVARTVPEIATTTNAASAMLE